MAVFTIRYDGIKDSISRAKSTAKALGRYCDDMNGVSSRISSLSGSDAFGYAATAGDLVKAKIRSAKNEQKRWENLARDLDSLVKKAEDTDKKVAQDIRYSGSAVIGERSLMRMAGDAIYGVFVSFTAKLGRLKIVGKLISGISNLTRRAISYVSGRMTAVRNYFKYGDGKYIVNIVKSLYVAMGAIAGLITTALAIAAASPFAIVCAVLALACGIVVLATKLADSKYAMESNGKAFGLASSYHREFDRRENWWEASPEAVKGNRGSLTGARYYGGITGYADYVSKTDYGSVEDNDAAMVRATIFSVVQTTAEIGQIAFSFLTSVANAQYIKDENGNWLKHSNGETVSRNELRRNQGMKEKGWFRNYLDSKREEFGETFKRVGIDKDAKGNVPKGNKRIGKTGSYQMDRDGNLILKEAGLNKRWSLKTFEGYDSKLPEGFKMSSTERVVYELFINGSKRVDNVTKTRKAFETMGELGERVGKGIQVIRGIESYPDGEEYSVDHDIIEPIRDVIQILSNYNEEKVLFDEWDKLLKVTQKGVKLFAS